MPRYGPRTKPLRVADRWCTTRPSSQGAVADAFEVDHAATRRHRCNYDVGLVAGVEPQPIGARGEGIRRRDAMQSAGPMIHPGAVLLSAVAAGGLSDDDILGGEDRHRPLVPTDRVPAHGQLPSACATAARRTLILSPPLSPAQRPRAAPGR